jgi:DNA transposition AAA+ family ATPase
VLRPAIDAYLNGRSMTQDQIAAMRAYIRQWIDDPTWAGERVVELRQGVDGLTTRAKIKAWLDLAEEEGIDPL